MVLHRLHHVFPARRSIVRRKKERRNNTEGTEEEEEGLSLSTLQFFIHGIVAADEKEPVNKDKDDEPPPSAFTTKRIRSCC